MKLASDRASLSGSSMRSLSGTTPSGWRWWPRVTTLRSTLMMTTIFQERWCYLVLLDFHIYNLGFKFANLCTLDSDTYHRFYFFILTWLTIWIAWADSDNENLNLFAIFYILDYKFAMLYISFLYVCDCWICMIHNYNVFDHLMAHARFSTARKLDKPITW